MSATSTRATPAKRGRKPTPENESKAEAFIRLGVPRTSNILDAIDSLANLSGSGYEYTPAQIEKIFAAIDNSLAAARKRFSGESVGKGGFSL